MNFRDNPEEAVFRAEVKDFIKPEYTGSGDEGEARGAAQAAAQGGPEAMARYQAWMKKLAKKGWIASAWPKEYGGAGMDFLQSFQQGEHARDGSIVAAGVTFSFGGSEQGWMLKLDASGEIVWEKTYGGGGDDEVQSFALLSPSPSQALAH